MTPSTHAEAYALLDAQPALLDCADLRVVGGGWLTSLGYDADRSWLGFYPSLLRRDPSGSWTFESLGLGDREDADAAALADWCSVLSPDVPNTRARRTWSVGPFTTAAPGGPAAVRAAHLAGVEHALTRIHRGAFYQVNLCTRLAAPFAGDVTTWFAEALASPALPYFLVDGRLAETTRGNLFVQAVDGVWCTPPLNDGLLPGVTRRAVLDLLDATGTPARIEPLVEDALLHRRPAFWTSSLSGAVVVDQVGDRVVDWDPSARDLVGRINRELLVLMGGLDGSGVTR